MRIAYLTSEYPPLPTGGIGTSLQHRARALVGSGHDVWVVGVGADLEHDDRGVRVSFARVRHLPKLGWLAVRRDARDRLRSLVRDEGVDVVVVPDWLGLSAGVDPECPVVIECNGSATYFGALLDEPVRRSVRWAERVALRHADRLTAVSRFTAARTRAIFGLSAECDIVPNGVDVTAYDSAVEPDPDLVVWIGTLVRKKGVIDLAEAFDAIVAERPATRLVMAGRDAPDRRSGSASTWSMIRSLVSAPARARMDHLGPVPYPEIPGLLATAALCVFPSHAEANPLSWIEAMAASRPVVGYRYGWAEEVVESGVTGTLVEPHDRAQLARAALRYLDDPTAATQAGHAGRARAEERFSAHVVIDQALAAYGRAMSAGARSNR